MANPQLEDGYVRVANEIIEKLAMAGFNGTQLSILLTVVRMTYGFNRTEAEISLSVFQKATGKNKGNVSRELSALQSRNVLTKVNGATVTSAASWKLNKDWEAWEGCQWLRGCHIATGCEEATGCDDATQRVAIPQQGGCHDATHIKTVTSPTSPTETPETKDRVKDSSSARSDSKSSSPADRDPPSPKFDVTIPLNDGSEYEIPLDLVHEWMELYPSVDVVQELREMRGWCLANPKKRKTRRGVLRFINGWLSREQDRGRSQARASPGGESTADYYRRIFSEMEAEGKL